jgi:hypothetical protein
MGLQRIRAKPLAANGLERIDKSLADIVTAIGDVESELLPA